MQSRLSLEEVELYFQAGVWAAARQLPRDEVRRALAEGRALGLQSREGDFASGEASLVPLEVGESPRKVEVVVPPNEKAFACFERDREHEVWEALAEDQIASAYRDLGIDAGGRVQGDTRLLAFEIARILPASMGASERHAPEGLPLLGPWHAGPPLEGIAYAKRILELARAVVEAHPRQGQRPNLLERDAHRILVRIGCRANLDRPSVPESLAELPSYRELLARHEGEIATRSAAPAAVAVKAGPQTILLPYRQRQGLEDQHTPTEARAMIACGACGMSTLVIAPITFTTYDDDHFGRFELWYQSHHEGTCRACNEKLDVFLRYTLTEVTGVTPHVYFLELDQVETRAGTLRASSS